MKLTKDEKAILRAAKHRKSDLYGDSVDRVRRLIDSQYGSPLCDEAQWNVIIDLIRKIPLTP